MADPTDVFTPYSTARALMGTLPTWMTEADAERIQAYQVYEQIYWNVPDTFKLVSYGTAAQPIYIPNGRVIVDTTNRYAAAGFGYSVDPQFGTTSDQANAALAFKALFDRERFLSKFHSNKKYGLIRGDWVWHIIADPLAVPGRRISIYPIDPASVFKVEHPDDPDRTQGIHIIDIITDGDKSKVKRQTYSRGPDPYDPDQDDGKIWSSMGIYSLEEWNLANSKVESVVVPPFPLPDAITAFPVYIINNQEEPGNPWGSSELRGFERLMAAVNQSISDEELALVLEGLGMYATNSGPPTDDDDNELPWQLGPGRVVELSGGGESDVFFKRINGIGSVAPHQDHLKFLIDSLREGSGTPKVATGQVDVSVAESGIALAIQMSPLLARVDVTDIGIRDRHVQMFYDLKAFFSAYEGVNLGEALIVPVFGEKMPRDKDAEVKRILAMVEAKVMSATTARIQLAELGYVFADNEDALISQEASASAAAADPFGGRLLTEGGAGAGA